MASILKHNVEAAELLYHWSQRLDVLHHHVLSPQWALPCPAQVDVAPPQYAKLMYKLVAVINGQATSIYDGTTTYPLRVTVYQEALPDHVSGLYVYPSVEECLRTNTTHVPSDSALWQAPRTVAVVLAWNHDDSRLPVAYGNKKAYSFVRVVELLPPPPSWHVSEMYRGVGRAGAAAPEPGSATGASEPASRPQSAQGTSAARMRQSMAPPWNSRQRAVTAAGGRSPEGLARAQATTLKLEQEVVEMEQQLAMTYAVLGAS